MARQAYSPSSQVIPGFIINLAAGHIRIRCEIFSGFLIIKPGRDKTFQPFPSPGRDWPNGAAPRTRRDRRSIVCVKPQQSHRAYASQLHSLYHTLLGRTSSRHHIATFRGPANHWNAAVKTWQICDALRQPLHTYIMTQHRARLQQTTNASICVSLHVSQKCPSPPRTRRKLGDACALLS